jgi:hypothetical protein
LTWYLLTVIVAVIDFSFLTSELCLFTRLLTVLLPMLTGDIKEASFTFLTDYGFVGLVLLFYRCKGDL